MSQMVTQHQVGIITLSVSEWRVYREARLRALSEDPQAYAKTYAESAALPDEMWQARLQSVADGSDWLFFACFDGEIVGMMGAYRPKDVRGTAVIWGVHVDRAQRGQGIGGKLMARLLDEHKVLDTTWQQLRPLLLAIAEGRTAELDINSVEHFIKMHDHHISLVELAAIAAGGKATGSYSTGSTW